MTAKAKRSYEVRQNWSRSSVVGPSAADHPAKNTVGSPMGKRVQQHCWPASTTSYSHEHVSLTDVRAATLGLPDLSCWMSLWPQKACVWSIMTDTIMTWVYRAAITRVKGINSTSYPHNAGCKTTCVLESAVALPMYPTVLSHGYHGNGTIYIHNMKPYEINQYRGCHK